MPVRILPDELFSSWLVRAALAQGCDPLVLTGVVWPNRRIWTGDLDRGQNDDQLRVLEKVSGIEISAFKTASIRPVMSAITQKPLEKLATWPWILALGARNLRRHGGLQYCPECLKTDIKPYYRRYWRIAWHTACSLHTISLVDKCPHCAAPIEPHRLLAQDRDIAICAFCGCDLQRAPGRKLVLNALKFQRIADQVAVSGQGQYGTINLPSQQWFELAYFFMMLLRKVALKKTKKLDELVKALGVNTDAIKPVATGLILELLSTQERSILLSNVWKMLNVGPQHFYEAVKTLPLSSNSLNDKGRHIPACIEDIIHTLPSKRAYKKRKKSGDAHKPRAKQAVKRMWARLQRKMAAQ